MFQFEKLVVWLRAIEYVDLIYTISEAFPARENFGLARQIQRAAVSVPSNVAEGNSRNSDADFARFVEISYGSLMETVTQLHIARRRNYCSEEHFQQALTLADEVARMLSGLRTSLVGRR